MPTFQRGNFSIKLGFEPMDGELAETDRQPAWNPDRELPCGVAGLRVTARG